MAELLWSWTDLIAATRGRPEGTASGGVNGISIDTRTLQPGDLFVAIRGDTQDGHVYVSKAFEKGAAAALVSEDFVTPKGAGPLIRVDEPLYGLRRLGIAARKRLSPEARVIAVTGSVGKTSTKDMLRRCLASVGPTHAAEKSYNNHWGVPLTLARMPKGTKFGVFEIGMNHAGEIRPLTKMVRPHVAIVTTVGPVHLEFFGSEEAIADAKAEIFEGLEAPAAMGSDPILSGPEPGARQGSDPAAAAGAGGLAILNADNKHFLHLKSAAMAAGARVVPFGATATADGFRLAHYNEIGVDGGIDEVGSEVQANLDGKEIRYRIGAKGPHQAANSGAALLAIQAVGADPFACAQDLGKFTAAAGRGERTDYLVGDRRVFVIDESYNANPLSMAAAIKSVGFFPTLDGDTRRIAVLGDMRELGDTSRQLHAALLQPITDAHIDLVFACGPHMAALYDALPEALRGGYAERSEGLIQPLLDVVRGGDVIMVKGSLGTRMAPIVEALKTHFGTAK